MPEMLNLAPGIDVARPEYGERVWFDDGAAQYVIDFLSLLCHTKGEWAGKPFQVLDWEREAIRQFYGVQTDYEDGSSVRYRQYLYEEIPKKNGKSEFAAGLGLYHLLMDGEGSPEIYLCAADRDNATIIYNAAKYMVEHIDFLSKPDHDPLVWAVDSKREIHSKLGGFIKVLSAEAFSKHGYSPSCVIFDELHAQPKRDLWDVMTGAAGSGRRQPVWIVLTTAGDDPDRKSIGWEIHEQCRRILNWRKGTPERDQDEDDPLWCPIMYGISVMTGDDPDKIQKLDIFDETLWQKCNPSLGKTVKMRNLRQEARTAKQSEGKERLFRWLRLNQWIATKTVGWIPLTIYDKTQWKPPEFVNAGLNAPEARARVRELLKGKKCFGGLDLSTTTDLTAFVLLFPPQDGLDHWVALFWAWVPTDDMEARERRDHVPYRDWIRAGFLNGCEGDMIDFTQVEETILQANEDFNIKCLGVDPYLSRTITQRLSDQGVNMAEIPQNIKTLSPAMKEMERLIRAHELFHEHNTCARWCFGNLRCYVDGNENIKPMKNKSIGRIDITVAWIIAFATAMINPGPNYDTENLDDDWGI